MTTYTGERMKDSFLTLIAATDAGRAPVGAARFCAPRNTVLAPAGNGMLAATSILYDHAIATGRPEENARHLAYHQANAFHQHFIATLPPDRTLVVTSDEIEAWLETQKETSA